MWLICRYAKRGCITKWKCYTNTEHIIFENLNVTEPDLSAAKRKSRAPDAIDKQVLLLSDLIERMMVWETHINRGRNFEATTARFPSRECSSIHSCFSSFSITRPLLLLCFLHQWGAYSSTFSQFPRYSGQGKCLFPCCLHNGFLCALIRSCFFVK